MFISIAAATMASMITLSPVAGTELLPPVHPVTVSLSLPPRPRPISITANLSSEGMGNPHTAREVHPWSSPDMMARTPLDYLYASRFQPWPIEPNYKSSFDTAFVIINVNVTVG